MKPLVILSKTLLIEVADAPMRTRVPAVVRALRAASTSAPPEPAVHPDEITARVPVVAAPASAVMPAAVPRPRARMWLRVVVPAVVAAGAGAAITPWLLEPPAAAVDTAVPSRR